VADAQLLLACAPCRRVVAVSYDAAAHAQGLIDLDEYRVCASCKDQMVEAVRDEDCTHILLPGDGRCDCHAAAHARSLRGAP
jgi:hypothetical protein